MRRRLTVTGIALGAGFGPTFGRLLTPPLLSIRRAWPLVLFEIAIFMILIGVPLFLVRWSTRCPSCRTRLGRAVRDFYRDKLDTCPHCAVSFDSEMPKRT